jgi:hypothetical protein
LGGEGKSVKGVSKVGNNQRGFPHLTERMGARLLVTVAVVEVVVVWWWWRWCGGGGGGDRGVVLEGWLNPKEHPIGKKQSI